MPRPSARMLLGAGLALAGLALGWLWLRDSSLARVERVTITGGSSSQAPQVRAALESAARGMSTLHVDRRALERAVAPYASVAGISARGSFPHELRVAVREHEPVAVLDWAGGSVAATADGRLLAGVRAPDVPAVDVRTPPARGWVRDARVLGALRIAGAAPRELRARATRLEATHQGIRLDLRDGPDLLFGSSGAARVKWLAAARVLAEDSAAGAAYLDLRVPPLVAAGGVGPVTPEPSPAPAVPQAEPSTIG